MLIKLTIFEEAKPRPEGQDRIDTSSGYWDPYSPIVPGKIRSIMYAKTMPLSLQPLDIIEKKPASIYDCEEVLFLRTLRDIEVYFGAEHRIAVFHVELIGMSTELKEQVIGCIAKHSMPNISFYVTYKD